VAAMFATGFAMRVPAIHVKLWSVQNAFVVGSRKVCYVGSLILLGRWTGPWVYFPVSWIVEECYPAGSIIAWKNVIQALAGSVCSRPQ